MMPRFSPLCLLLTTLLVPALAPATAHAQNQSTKLFRSLGLLGPNASLTRVNVKKPAQSQNRLAPGALTTGQQNLTGPLKFTFSGFTTQQQRVLQNFLRDNYSRMVAVYGAPAPEQAGQTIKVERLDSGNSGFIPQKAGSTDGNIIEFNYEDDKKDAVNTYNFTRNVLVAFQGSRIPSFNFLKGYFVEPWLYGMSDAAALQVAYLAGGSKADFNPSAVSTYALPIYDYLNRPGLGNAYIYPHAKDDSNPNVVGEELAISFFRAAMAQSAFLKIAAENPQFFAQFNAKLYARGPAESPITSDELKSLAGGVVPTVEGRDFNDWARAQYVLDATVTTGQKLYMTAYPLAVGAKLENSTIDVPTASVFVQAFVTNPNGSETASTGYGSIRAFDQSGRDISAQSSNFEGVNLNVLSFDDGDAPGQASAVVGFKSFNASNRMLVTLKANYGQAEATNYSPYGAAGTASSTPSYFGGTIGGQNGPLQLSGSATQTVNVVDGTWAATAPYKSGPRVQTAFTFGGATVRRNTAWLVSEVGTIVRSTAFLLEVPSNLQTLNFSTPSGKSSVRMVSLPGFPLQTDEAAALNQTPGDLKLARYRPNLSPATLKNGALQFGIGGDRYELYPHISAPIAPGRGYWLGVGEGGYATQVKASLPPADRAYEVPLQGGWNQIGVPFNRNFAPASILVRNGGFAPVSLGVARARGWVAPGIWRWLPAGGYVRADVGDSQLVPFEGYFIFAGPQSGVSLIFDASANGAAKTSLARTEAGGWSVTLHAKGKDTADIAGVFGVSSEPNVAKPPAGARVVSLRFEGAAPGAAEGSGLAEMYAATLGEGARWNVVVDGAGPGENVTLNWGKFTGEARKVALTLTDNQTGARVPMKSGGEYQFVAGAEPRRLTIAAVAAPLDGASNRAPVAYDGTANSARGAIISKALRASDPDGDALTFRLVRGTRFGRSSVALDPADGKWKLRVTGTGRARGDADRAWFVAVDANGAESNVAKIKIRYRNRAPVASDGKARVSSGEKIVVPVAGLDADGEALTFQIVGEPRRGTSRLRRDSDGVWKLSYRGRAGWTGVDKVRFVAIDAQGQASAPATMIVTVTASDASASGAGASAIAAPDVSGGAS